MFKSTKCPNPFLRPHCSVQGLGNGTSQVLGLNNGDRGPRCLLRWADVIASYYDKRDNKNDVDKKLLLEMYTCNKYQQLCSFLSRVIFAHGSVAVLGNNCKNISILHTPVHRGVACVSLDKPDFVPLFKL
jgi:hypothetical protein